jgi:putative membrane protein
MSLEEHEDKGSAGDPRVRFAGERTLLAWMRTGIALMGFGFVVARFGLFLRELAEASHTPPPASVGFSLWIGTALVLLGVAAASMAAAQHIRFLQRLARGEPYRPPSWSLGVAVAAVLAAVGIMMTVYLLLLHP